MNLGIFLYRGGSLRKMSNVGQENRFINYYLKKYSKSFDNVFVFSYEYEEKILPENCIIIKNKYRIPLFFYQFLLPILNRKYVKKCQIFRVFHISGTLPAIITKVLFGKKYLVTYGYLWSKTRNREKSGFLKVIENIFIKIIEFVGLRMAENVIVTVNLTKKYVKRYVSEGRIKKIPNSVDTNLFRPEIGIKKNDNVIFVGRLTKIKNLYNLIKAFSYIDRNKKLIIIGDGSEKEALRKLSERLECNVLFKGLISYEMIPIELNKSDVFVLPSFSEGQPKVLLEAMACGLPCIVSDIPSLREVIKDGYNGFLCKTDPDSIRDCIKKVLDNPGLAKKVGRNARKYVEENFSADVLIEKEIKLLKEVGKR